jgi:hypothetical protein
MAVAKSFKDFEQLCEPFEKNKRMYVIVKNPKTQNERTVRWYTDFEYAKMYPEEKVSKPVKSLKTVLGFNKGYITIFSNAAEDDEWFCRSIARWHAAWGWYIISTEEVPADLPSYATPHKLYWKDVSTDGMVLRDRDELEKLIFSILYSDSPSSFVGKEGDRINLSITVTSVKPIETSYGEKGIYYMEDADGNVFKWITSIRDNFTVGNKLPIRGTVKAHGIENGLKVTTLARCMERSV